MRYAIDCEFDGFNGPLLSMALVGADGVEFYEVIEYDTINDPWVVANVVPILIKTPISYKVFQEKLREFLKQSAFNYPKEPFVVFADWPDDIKYFCQSLITGPGEMMNIPNNQLVTLMVRGLDIQPEIPHNALSDARAIMKSLKHKNYI